MITQIKELLQLVLNKNINGLYPDYSDLNFVGDNFKKN